MEKFRKYFKRNFGKLKNEKIVDDLDFEINFGAYQYVGMLVPKAPARERRLSYMKPVT